MSPHRTDLLATLHPVTRALRRLEELASAKHGLTMWQYAILSVVAQTTGLNQRDVANRLQYSVNRIIRDLDFLSERGLLTRRSGPDRRANLLSVTAAGSELERQIRADIQGQEDVLLAGLSSGQREALYGALRHLEQQVRPDVL
jgi:DNA-binding MarR family transcriptional regulator